MREGKRECVGEGNEEKEEREEGGPVQLGVILPSGETAVASVKTRPAPPTAN